MLGRTLLLVAALLGAGCVAPPDDLTPAATAPAGDAARWWDVPVEGAPDGALTSFWWTVPEGAVVPWAFNERFGWDERVVPLEATLVLPDGVAPERWAVVAFLEDDEGLVLETAIVRAPATVRARELAGDPTSEEHAAEAAPFFLHAAWGEDVRPGDRVGFVVALATPAPVQARFAFRLLDEDFSGGDAPTRDAAAFLQGLVGAAGAQPVEARGRGLHVASFVDVAGLLPSAYRASMGDVVVEEEDRVDAGPLAGSGRLGVSSAFASPSGWGVVYGFAFADLAAGAWSARAAVRGETLEADGVLAGPSLATNALVGGAWFTALGDGAGPHEARLDLDATGPDADRFILYWTLGLGAPLSTLLGADAATGTFAGEDALPPAWSQGGAVRARLGDAVVDLGDARFA